MKAEKIRTSILLDKQIFQEIKHLAIDKKTTQYSIIENYVKKGLYKEYDCEEYTVEEEEELIKDIKKVEQEIANGEFIKLTSDEFDDRYG
ncbi:MAG: hypothetical protein LBT10_03445 [Methanobrevibacter sp.]|jgi:hypothetical protein|nr:hypothetical protein [Methanobrevibacter sp.]